MAARWQRTLFIQTLVFLTIAGCIVVAPLARAQAGPIVIPENFPGITFNDTFSVPPDSNGAASPSNFVEFVNGAYAVYDKTGAPVNVISDAQFWSNAGIGSNVTSAGLSDPRIIFDPSTQRWFASQITVDNTGNSVLVARSDTSDPAGAWKAVNFIGSATGFADFPTLGLDANGVYVGVNNFTSSSGTFSNASFFSIPKSDLTASTPTIARMTTFANLNTGSDRATLQGAIDLSGPSGTILSTDLSFGSIDRRTVIGSGGANATLSSPTTITGLSDGTPILARQPDGTSSVDTNDNRISASVYQVGNLLYAARSISDNTNPTLATHDTVHWLVLNATTNAVVQQGTISDPSFDYFFPSIAANPNGDMVLAFNRSGGSASGVAGNISSFAQVCRPSGGVLTCGNPFLLQAGDAGDYHLLLNLGVSPDERWGDYSTTTVDPNNPLDFWTIQELPMANDPLLGITSWETWITEISLAPIPEPSTFALMGLGLLGFASARRRLQPK